MLFSKTGCFFEKHLERTERGSMSSCCADKSLPKRIISFSKKTLTGLLTNWPCPNSKERLPIRLTCRRGCFGSVLYGFPGRSPAFHLMSMPASLTDPLFSLFSLLDCTGSSQMRIITYLPRRHQFLTTDFSRDIYALFTTVRDYGGN